MKQGWEIKKLGEVATYLNGFAFKPGHWGNVGLPIVRIQNLNNEDAEFNYCDSEIPKKYVINDGDILISWSASLGVYEWKRGKAYLNQHIFKVVFDKIGINKYYLKYVVGAKLNYMLKDAHGATMKHIVKGDFDNTPIPVPPISEQEHIVEELDLLSSVIEKQKLQLKEYDTLAQSIFYTMFGDPVGNDKGWNIVKFADGCVEIGDGLHGTPNYDVEGTIPFINGTNLIDGRIIVTDRTLFVNETEAMKYRVKMDTNTVLLSINGTLGKTAIYQDENVILGKSACFCRLKKEYFNVVFVERLMNTDYFKKFLEENSSKSTIKNVGLKTIRNYKIVVPSLFLQQEFAEKIEAIEKQKELVKQSLAETETLFNSRMEYYFN